jgi:ketosteroid isomerase-like protein
MKQFTATIFLILAASAAAVGNCSEADRKALEAFDRAWGAAGLNGDKAALTAVYADDYVGLPTMIGKAQTVTDTMRAFEESKASPSASNTTFDHYLISCTPTTATITHRNTTTSKGDGGKESTTYSRSVHFLEKRGGKWQAVSNTGGNLTDADLIWYLEQDWNNALMKRDKAWFEKNYASDFSSVSSTSANLVGKMQEISDIVNDKGLELAETSDMNIRVEGNMAVVTGIFRTKGKDEKGAAYDRRTRYTDTWIKRDGRWQAWASQGTVIPPVQNVARN